MTRDDAYSLAAKIDSTWRGGPKAEVWAEELEELHFGQAQCAYFQLRKSEEHAPSIAKFLALYHSLTQHDDVRDGCTRCDGGGWIDAPEHARHSPDCARRRAEKAERFAIDPLDTPPADECHCNAVVPCTCSAGRQRQASFTRITGGRTNT